MPGPWVHLAENDDYFQSLELEKGAYVEATVYDDGHHEQGKALWRVHKQEEKKPHGMWVQANLVACSDPHLHWWTTDGPGGRQRGQFLLHFCTVAEARCNKTKRKKQSEFHTDYFRLLTTSDVSDLKVAWMKQGDAKVPMEKEIARLAGRNPPEGASGSRGGKDKGSRPPDLEWSDSEGGPPEIGGGEEEAKDIRKKLQALKDQLAKVEGTAGSPRGGEGKRKPEGASRKKGEKPDKKEAKDKRQRLGDPSDSEEHRKGKPDPLWFGRRRHEPSSGASGESASGDPSADEEAKEAKGKAKKTKTKKKGPKKRKKADRGPFGIGKRQRYDGKKDEDDSSADEEGDESVFQAGPSSKSRQLALIEYAEKHPGRQTELKHGRISMLATMGYITPEITGKFPGYLSPSAGLKFADVPNGLAAISKVPAAGWGQILAYMAFCEVSQDQSPGTPAAAGDFGFKVLTASDPAEKTKKLSAELANGRLAMMAIIGMFFQDGLTGSAWGDWANYTASPLRAFENELGVQAPVGFWDPAGFTADGSVENFKRRRQMQTELKHGRISMLATMGYITPEITGKFPGYLSPSAGLKFADVPNGLAAISKVPAAGWGQILAYMAFCEVSQDQSPGTPAAAGDFGFKVQTELKHGRISMLATMGYITPEITGKFPGYLSPSAGLKFADVPNGLAAISKVPAAGWGQILAYMAFCEVSQDQSPGTPAAAGDFGFKVLTASDPAEKTKKLSAELANGRLAMMAIIGMFFQDGLTGSAWGDWANYTASPLRAFENELGVQAPVGFWDPAGKFPGYLSPSAGLKFADVPNGLDAISKVPAAGWGQILAYMAFCEVSQDQSPGTPAAAGDFGFKVLTASDPAEKTKKLSAELANGRLAMMAIIGMFFQDGLTGSAWGDWANYTASPLR
eukprot:Skav219097  [mRNA]  locus=scaffold1574:159526:176924:+ [translate_table: standard]